MQGEGVVVVVGSVGQRQGEVHTLSYLIMSSGSTTTAWVGL